MKNCRINVGVYPTLDRFDGTCLPASGATLRASTFVVVFRVAFPSPLVPEFLSS